MQYILDEHEYNELQRAKSEQNDLLQKRLWDLQEELKDKERVIARLIAEIRTYKNKYETLWNKTEGSRYF